MRNSLSSSCLAAMLAWMCAVGTVAAADAQVEITEAGPVNQDAQYVTSPQGAHLATITRKGSRMVVMIDGVAGPKFDEIVPAAPYIDPRGMLQGSFSPKPVVFSRDGKRWAYLGRQGQEWVVMADGKEVARETVANAGSADPHLVFTGGDGRHLMFSHAAGSGYELWVDGQKMPGAYASGGGGSEGTVDPIITPDGARYVYAAQIDRDKRAVIVDGKDAGYAGDNLQFTADGQHLLSLIRQGANVGLAVDGRVRMKTDGISHLCMAPVGNGFAAVLRRLNPPGEFLVVNAKRIENSDCASISKVIFSPDGKHYAAVCTVSPVVKYVLIDGKKGQQYDDIPQPEIIAFSSNSSKLGYVARSAGKYFIVINEDESDAFETTPGFMFSPDSSHVVMTGMQNARSPQSPGGVISSFPVFIDGKAERVARGMNLDTFVFSPDMSRHAYFGGSIGQGMGVGDVFLDGKVTGINGNFTFSPDSKHVAIAGRSGTDNKAGLFLDGKLVYKSDPGVRYRAFTPDSRHLFWMALEPAKGGQPGTYEYVTYVDGKEAARCDRIESGTLPQIFDSQGSGQFIKTPPAWNVGSDGMLTFLGPSGDVVKRFRVTPPVDTSLATMLAAAASSK